MTKTRWLELKRDLAHLTPGPSTAVVIAVDLALLALATWLGTRGSLALSLCAIPPLIVALLHAYLLLHEAAHSAIGESRGLNHFVGHVCGWLLLMPFLPRQRSHLLHHTWTGHPVGDPANQRIIRRFSVMNEAQARKLERVWRSWFPLITINDRLGMWRDPLRRWRAGERATRVTRELTANALVLASYVVVGFTLLRTGLLGPFALCYVPALFVQMLCEELLNLPHHAETPLLEEDDPALPYWEQDRVTHSCGSLPFWSRFVILNFNQHTAHHMFPWIPWSGLPEAQAALATDVPRLAEQTVTHELAWSARNRRRPLLGIMGHYLDHVARAPADSEAQREAQGALADAQ